MNPSGCMFGVTVAVIMLAAGCGSRPAGEASSDRVDPQANQPADRSGQAAQLTDRGIGLMGQFNFADAATAFAKARKLDPDTRLLQINHAIALLNTATPDNLDEARRLLRVVLNRAPEDPHAHFCLGIIALHRNELEEARPHFKAVTRADPSDPSGWYHLGLTLPPGSAEATACFEQALALNPNLTAAMHGLAMNLRRSDPERARELLTGQQALLGAEWDEPLRIRYAEMGRYGNVIVPGLAVGKRPSASRSMEPLPVVLPVFAAAEPLASVTGAAPADPRSAVGEAHDRFGSILLPIAMTAETDLGLLVLDRGRLALFERSPNGGFDHTTARHPGLAALSGAGVAIAAAIGDFDNDGRGDLAISTAEPTSALRLLRNDPDKGFVDISQSAGVAAVNGPAIGLAWLDLDQDGDLDLILARSENAGGTAVLVNTSIAPAAAPNSSPPPLEPRFQEQQLGGLSGLPAATVVTSDFDDDRDLDLLLLGADHPRLVRNDRLLRFRAEPLAEAVTAADGLDLGTTQAGLVLDINADGLFERLLLRQEQPPLLEGPQATVTASSLPPLTQAATADFDLDGQADLAGLTPAGAMTVLMARPQRQWIAADLPASTEKLVAVCPADLDADGVLDLVTLTAAGELHWQRNTLTGRRAVRLVASGRRDRATSLRTNADGVGLRTVALAGPLLASWENTTLAAGLGQPRLPLYLGIGTADQADVVRLVWPDGVPQAELDVPADRLVRIEETSRKTTSCPVLFAWTGEGFTFVTDFLGGGVTGETLPDGSIRSPRPHETVLIRPSPAPVAESGRQHVRLLITEPFDEVLYLDGLQLVACDHPVDWAVIADERFPAAGPPPTGDLLIGGPAIPPRQVVTESGRDVTQTLAASDGSMTTPPRPRSWLGYAERHSVTLTFDNELNLLPSNQPVVLELDGWTDYPYPESMWAAGQAGIAVEPPQLSRRLPDGGWSPPVDVGFFAGLPRVMGLLLDREFLGEPPAVFRLETAMQIGWDRAALRPLLGRFAQGGQPQPPVMHDGRHVTRHLLPLASAELRYGGLARETPVGDRGLVAYDLASREPVPVSRWEGLFSRPGDVSRELAAVDRQLVICGPGFDVDCRFATDGLPDLPVGYSRTWFLEANGITRDTSPLTAAAGLVQPIPAFD